MAPQNLTKPKRQRKKKPRTEVSSSGSEPEVDPILTKSQLRLQSTSQNTKAASSSAETASKTSQSWLLTDEQIREKFTQHYLQRVTAELAEDLDKIRSADDFRGVQCVDVLVSALKGGVDGWGIEEMRRVVGEGQ